jgi:transposase InsO family protein
MQDPNEHRVTLTHPSADGRGATSDHQPTDGWTTGWILTTTGLLMEDAVSRKGNCYDNAMAESFFATLKRELMSKDGRPTKAEARAAVFEWIAVYCNRQRHHSSLGYRTPLEFETLKEQTRTA